MRKKVDLDDKRVDDSRRKKHAQRKDVRDLPGTVHIADDYDYKGLRTET